MVGEDNGISLPALRHLQVILCVCVSPKGRRSLDERLYLARSMCFLITRASRHGVWWLVLAFLLLLLLLPPFRVPSLLLTACPNPSP